MAARRGHNGDDKSETPSFAAGSALDKFLLKPGFCVPPSPAPAQAQSLQDELEIAEHALYPGEGVSGSRASDHFPIAIPVTCQHIPNPAPERKLKINHLLKEDRGLKDQQLKDKLQDQLPGRILLGTRNCPGTVFRGIQSSVRTVFGPEIRITQPKRDRDPLERFLLANLEHPEVPYLLTALQWGDDAHVETAMGHINSDNWKRYVANISRVDAKAIFEFLDGNKKAVAKATCAP